MTDDSPSESFEAFKNSFSYGSRTDLNFKFLTNLSNEDAARFFQELVWKVADSFEAGRHARGEAAGAAREVRRPRSAGRPQRGVPAGETFGVGAGGGHR